MRIAIASGKGGTGKTTVASSLASIWGAPVAAVDLDVEEPNLHLFLKPRILGSRTVLLETPVLDPSKCTLCRQCVDLCQFKALAVLDKTLLVFQEMCHGCGGCLLVCPEKALSVGGRELGVIEWGEAGTIEYLMGRLRVGEAMSPPLMRAVKEELRARLAERPMDALLDAPPGVSCPAVNAVMDSDAILLVTEPTPFGLHDFALAFEAFSPLSIPMAAVINRAGIGNDAVADFCRAKGLPVLAEIPHDRAIAEGYARGRIVAELNPELKGVFIALRDAVRGLARKEAAHV